MKNAETNRRKKAEIKRRKMSEKQSMSSCYHY